MIKTVIFDIDGTLADISERRKFLETKPKNWKEFNNPVHIAKDKPNENIIALYQSLLKNFEYKIILVSGRGEKSRESTVQWLAKNLIYFNELYMRKNNDYRDDTAVKQEILDSLLQAGHDILFAVDDRTKVVKMWRDNGITCLQCADGDF